ncbi:carboxypeptidase-like regulatory domain-containing protein [Mucilaginibacter sp. dw_454]|uniref:carboxypeptidase-like regulatory domain-containing protein n=1 Tax=Mucilaginibacter sp. dw_454 TaxID=2720079 RepID=UPI001BD4A9F5|nr:carboxypeptidase-like regulatory domain-containing protein [Mucilaginibacter sp. dw_454]
MKQLFFMLMLLIAFNASAQNKLSITGKVTGEGQKPIAGATIFIGGTQFATATNADGRFEITVPNAGSYHLLVNMLGYSPAGKDVMLRDKPIDLAINLIVKPIQLHPVNIGADKNWAKNYAIFKKEFLGNTINAGGCTILNPEVIYFSTREGQLYADADDFLIIENHKLGYRIKYLLQTFRHKINTINTAYNGDAVFEELPGTGKQKKEWVKNRLDTYQGSMMHFFRAVFSKTVMENGFIVKQVYLLNGNKHYDEQPVNFDELAFPLDTSFVSFRFTHLDITYNPKKVARLLKRSNKLAKKDKAVVENLLLSKKPPSYESELLLPLKNEAIVDARGSVPSGYLTTFFVIGDWINKRVGDQLPFEYRPYINTSSP